MYQDNSTINLLRKAIQKQIELREMYFWAEEIPELCPPVLWFGNHKKHPPVVTVGANPSRWEFLDRRTDNYLHPSKRRFHQFPHPGANEHLENKDTLEKILRSYNLYFQRNPYRQWFGKPLGGKLEAFLNGLDASFYSLMKHSAVHTDLVPFVTMSDFSQIEHRVADDIFQDGWATRIFDELMNLLMPVAIVVFGRKNVEFYNRYSKEKIPLDRPLKINKRDLTFGITQKKVQKENVPLIGLNINLGNAYGFSRNTLLKIGQYLEQVMELG